VLGAADRMAAFDTIVWTAHKESIIQGHRAVATVLRQVQPERWYRMVDDEVQIRARWTVSGDAAEATMPASSFATLVQRVEVTEVFVNQAPAVVTYATVRTGAGCLAIIDWSGVGRLAAGDREFHSNAERSGVPEVNRRRARAMQTMYLEYGKPEALDIATGVRAEEIIDWWNHPLWQVGPMESQEPDTLSDTITNALCVEAWGAARQDHVRARAWEQRYVEEDPPLDDFGSPTPSRSVTYGPVDDRGQLTSDWSVSQLARDPVGDLIAGLIDGTLETDGAASSSVLGEMVDHWRSAGLTDREIKVEFLARAGWTNRQIGDEISRAESTARDIRKAAQKKLSPKQSSDQR
jgi:hypothetical protein